MIFGLINLTKNYETNHNDALYSQIKLILEDARKSAYRAFPPPEKSHAVRDESSKALVQKRSRGG